MKLKELEVLEGYEWVGDDGYPTIQTKVEDLISSVKDIEKVKDKLSEIKVEYDKLVRQLFDRNVEMADIELKEVVELDVKKWNRFFNKLPNKVLDVVKEEYIMPSGMTYTKDSDKYSVKFNGKVLELDEKAYGELDINAEDFDSYLEETISVNGSDEMVKITTINYEPKVQYIGMKIPKILAKMALEDYVVKSVEEKKPEKEKKVSKKEKKVVKKETPAVIKDEINDLGELDNLV